LMCSPLSSDAAVAPRSQASLRLCLETDSVDSLCFCQPRAKGRLRSVARNSSHPSQAIGAYLSAHGALPMAGVKKMVPKLRKRCRKSIRGDVVSCPSGRLSDKGHSDVHKLSRVGRLEPGSTPRAMAQSQSHAADADLVAASPRCGHLGFRSASDMHLASI
jgi:hypothetical protein